MIELHYKKNIFSTIHRCLVLMLLHCFVALGVKAQQSWWPQGTNATGIDNGVVYLNDLEDHNWTYYSGVNRSVDNGYYNDNYKGLIYSPNPRNIKITYNANGGAVSINEPETSFVYYKTLEQSNNQYTYTTIDNPFSKRPSNEIIGADASSTKQLLGFAGWKIKSISEGTIITGGNTSYTTEEGKNIIPAETEIVFNFTSEYSENCISAEVVLEATWEEANVTYLSDEVQDDNTNYEFSITKATGATTYENNFLVINKNYSGTITVNSPCTIMMVEPDGSVDYRNSYTFTGGITPMPSTNGRTKIEFAKWKPTSDIDAMGRNFTIGRGMSMQTSGQKALYGSGTINADVDQILKIESGYFNTFTHYAADINSVTKQWITFGCDYDRSKGEIGNNNLTFTGVFLVGAKRNLGSKLTVDREFCRVYSLSGNFMKNVKISNGAQANSYYLAVTTNSAKGHRYFEIQGGIWHANIAGGMDTNTPTTRSFTFRMRGGLVKGSIYGAAQHASGSGIRSYVITGGIVNGWVAGGANGTNFGSGTMNGTSYVYVGGNARIDSGSDNKIINRAVGGNVFGAGCGYCDISNSGKVTYGTNVVIADNAYVQRGVYGGGSFGYCGTDRTSYIYITGGKVDGKSGGVNASYVSGSSSDDYEYNAVLDQSIQGGVYGGACQNKGGNVNIFMTGGTVNGGIYGGSNASGVISGNVNIKILGGQVGTSSAVANVHGGGYGSSTIVTKNIEITIDKFKDSDGAIIYGDVYGGSALGNVNCSFTNETYQYTSNTTTNVTLKKGTIYGSLYGGALGSNDVEANVYGPVSVKVYGGSVKSTDVEGSGGVYGANNVKGAPKSTVTVDIYGTDGSANNEYALYAVYGGGNKADYIYDGYPIVKVYGCDNSIEYVYGGGNAAAVKATNVTIWGGNTIGNVFGGGNGTISSANVLGDTNVNIFGGSITNVYGGSNNQGNIDGNLNVNILSQAEPEKEMCPLLIDNVYAGGNKAASKVGILNIGCTGENGRIENIYGGANQADIEGNIDLHINSGNIGNVFGGNNTSGSISGTITVTIGDNPSNDCGVFFIDNVYGGGNLAAYGSDDNKKGDYPKVNIKGGLVRNAIFGGGLGSTAIVYGNPQVNIVNGIVGYTLKQGNDEIVQGGNIFGGGNEAPVIGNTNVTISGGEIKQNVYGGGNKAAVSGTTNVVIGK